MILVVDGNSLMNTVISATLYTTDDGDLSRPFFMIEGKYIIKDKAEKYYKNCILTYLYNVIASFPSIEKIYFATDSKSWRKPYFAKFSEKFESRPDYSVFQEGYKGRRKIDSEQKEQMIELLKYMTNNVIQNLNKTVPGFVCLSMKGLEGDDILAHIVNNYDKSEEIVVWTNDSDMVQILRKNVYIIGSNDKKTCARKLFSVKKDDATCTQAAGKLNFSRLNENRGAASATLEGLVSRGFYNETIIDPVHAVFTKILCGDKNSDNIPASFCYKNDKDKIVNVTEAKVSNIVYKYLIEDKKYTESDIISNIDTFNDDFLNTIAAKICEIMKVSYNDNSELIVNGLKFNIKLIRLCNNCIPRVLTEYIDSVILNAGTALFDSEQFKKLID